MRRAGAAAITLCTSLGTLLLAGCGILPGPVATPDTDGVPAALRPYYGQQLAWSDCGEGFRCATAEAPLDWAAPGGDRIELALAMRPADGEPIGTLFTNPGGPGASGIEFLTGAVPTTFSDELLDRYDVVSWDPRGIGDSTAVDCYGTRDLDRFLFSDPDLPEGSAALRDDLEQQGTAFGAACETNTGPLLAHVGTADTVRDLDMLRAALGERLLDYIGFSYGTEIGAQYADAYPDRVGRMVLDGAVDPATTPFEVDLAQTRAFGEALETYLADCIESAECPFRGLTVEQATDLIEDLLIALRESPQRSADGRDVNGAVLRTAINASLYAEESWPYLTQAFAGVLAGDPRIAQALADSYVERGEDGYTGNLFEAIYAVSCLDAPVETDPAELERQGALLDEADPLRRADNAEDLGNPVCANWPVPPQGEPGPVTATGAPPILVLGTTGDPATPYEWAEALADQLPDAVLLTLVGEGHTAYRVGDPCINDPVDAFLLDGTVPAAVRCG